MGSYSSESHWAVGKSFDAEGPLCCLRCILLRFCGQLPVAAVWIHLLRSVWVVLWVTWKSMTSIFFFFSVQSCVWERCWLEPLDGDVIPFFAATQALCGPTVETVVDIRQADVCMWRNHVAAYIVIITLQVISAMTNQTDMLCLHISKEQGWYCDPFWKRGGSSVSSVICVWFIFYFFVKSHNRLIRPKPVLFSQPGEIIMWVARCR